MTSRRFPWQRAVMSFVRWDELQCAQVVAESTQPGECSSSPLPHVLPGAASPQLAVPSRGLVPPKSSRVPEGFIFPVDLAP